jgi:hypothetical protein
MYRVLRSIIGDVLRAKLAIGLGNNEIRLLRHFDQTTWMRKKFHWSDKALTLINDSENDIKLTITRFTDLSDGAANEKIKLILFKRGTFVWFMPKGRYSVESSSKSGITIKKTEISLLSGDFTLVLRKNK